jgi:hypothetical protein
MISTTLALRGLCAAISSQNLTASASIFPHSDSGMVVSSSLPPVVR